MEATLPLKRVPNRLGYSTWIGGRKLRGRGVWSLLLVFPHLPDASRDNADRQEVQTQIPFQAAYRDRPN